MVGTELPKGKANSNITKKSIAYINKECREAYMSLIQAGTNFNILQLAKRGIVDVNSILNNDTPDKCLLLSVYIGLIYEDCNTLQNLFETLQKKFKNTSDLQKYVYKEYKIESKKLMSISKFTEQLNYIGKQIDRRIAVFAAKEGLSSNFQSTFITTNKSQNRCIKIVLFDHHSYFLFTKKNIEKKSTEYCDFCCQSFSNILTHKCVFEKCQSCFRYLSNYKTIGCNVSNLCQNDPKYEESCFVCSKHLQNKQCSLLHSKLSKYYCKHVKYCDKCKKLHQDNNHDCLTPFCRQCYRHHSKTKFCQIVQIRKKHERKKCFVIHYEDKEEQYMSITEIDEIHNEKSNTIHIFNNRDNTYESILVDNFGNPTEKTKVCLEDNFVFCLSNILQVLCGISKCKCIAIISNSSFLKVIRLETNISEFKVYQKNNNLYKIENKNYVFVTSFEFFNLEDIELCFYLKNNPYPFLLNMAFDKLDETKDKDCLTTELFLSKIHHTDLSIINLFEDHQYYIKKFSTLSKALLLKEKCIHVILTLLKACNKLVNIFASIVGHEKNATELLASGSMISLFYQKLSELLEDQGFPVLPSFKPGNLKNTSRHELFVSEIIVSAHLSRFPNHNILSCVNGTGEQKKIKNLTADIFCDDCNVAIYVEGSFKYFCEIHETKEQMNQRKLLLDKMGKYKRNTLCTELKVQDIFILPTCCIEEGLYTQEFMNSSFFDERLLASPKKKIKEFQVEYYQRLNCQDAILSPVSLPIVKGFKCLKGEIEKLDIEAAFLSVFSKKEFILPKNNDSIQLIGKEAHDYFLNSNLKSTFMIARIFMLPHQDLDFQIVPMKLAKGKSTYFYYCKTCALNGIFAKNMLCNHTKFDRGLYVTCYSTDLQMFKFLKYYFEITEIIAFPASHNERLGDFFSRFKTFKKVSNCSMEKLLAKKAALSCLGRTALNISKYHEENLKFSSNCTEIGFYMQSKLVQTFHIFDKCILMNIIKTKKTSNFRRYISSCSRNTSSLLFGAANNEIRKTMIEVYLFTKLNISYQTKILRISVDCFFIYFNNCNDKAKLKQKLEKTGFNFKLEDRIKTIVNHKNAGYIVKKKDGTSSLKIPGCSLSVLDRRDFKLSFKDIYSDDKITSCNISPNFLMF